MSEINLKEELAKQAEAPAPTTLKKSMSIAELIKAMEPQIKRALPATITPERFTRIALSALNQNPKLKECSPISFLSALMSAAQLGLEVNSSLNHAFLIPFKNKGIYEVEFIIGYRGLLDLAYRSPQVQTVQAHAFYENDFFSYELGLNPNLIHKPALENRGEFKGVYAMFKLQNGGFGFEVMSKADIDLHAKTYSKTFESSFSPWKTNYEDMSLKTVVKKVLKFCPMKTEYVRAMEMDNALRNDLKDFEIPDGAIETDFREVV